MSFNCPSCHSENTQRLSVVYESGISDINTKSRGWIFGMGGGDSGVGITTSKTKGTSQTAASLNSSPPEKMGYWKLQLLLFVICAVLVGMFAQDNKILEKLFTIIWLCVSAFFVYRTFKFNQQQWPKQMRAWENTFQCNRCNEVFTVDQQ